MKYNVKMIMKAAHKNARSLRALDNSYTYSGALDDGLRLAWEAVKAAGTANGASAAHMSGAEALQRMSGAELDEAALRMSWYEYGKRDARIDPVTGRSYGNVFQWIDAKNPARDIEEVKQEAVALLLESVARDPARAERLTFARLLSRSVIYAAQKINRNTRRNPVALASKPADDNDGDDAARVEYVIDNAAPLAQRGAAPEEAAIISDAINRACLDALDREIIAEALNGWTASESAARHAVAVSTITRRRAAILARYKAA